MRSCFVSLPVSSHCLQESACTSLCAHTAGDAPGRVTGSEDHTARVWDLRKRKVLYTLAAHSSLVSQARARFQCDP